MSKSVSFSLSILLSVMLSQTTSECRASGGTFTHYLVDIAAGSPPGTFPEFAVLGYPGGLEGGSNSDLYRMVVYTDLIFEGESYVWFRTLSPGGTLSAPEELFSLEAEFQSHVNATNNGNPYFNAKLDAMKAFSTTDGTPMVAVSWGSTTPSAQFRAIAVFMYQGNGAWTKILALEDRDWLDTSCTSCSSCGQSGAPPSARDILVDGRFSVCRYPHGSGTSWDKGYVLFTHGPRCDNGCSATGSTGRHSAILAYVGSGSDEGIVEVNDCVMTEVFDLSLDAYSDLGGHQSAAFFDEEAEVARFLFNFQEGIYSRVAAVDQVGNSLLLHTRKGGGTSDFASVKAAGSIQGGVALLGRPSWSDLKSFHFSTEEVHDLTFNSGGQFANPAQAVRQGSLSMSPSGRPLVALQSHNNQSVQVFHPLDLLSTQAVYGPQKDFVGQTVWSSDMHSTRLNGVESPSANLSLTTGSTSQHVCLQNGWTLIGTPVIGNAGGNETRHILLTTVRGATSWATYTDSTPTNLTISGTGPQIAIEVFNNGSEFQVPTDPDSLFRMESWLDPGSGMNGSETVRIGVIEPATVNFRRASYTDLINYSNTFGLSSTLHSFCFASAPGSNNVIPGTNFFHSNPSSSRTLEVESVTVSRVGELTEESSTYSWSFNASTDVYQGSGTYDPATQWRVPYSTAAGLHQYFAYQPTESVYGECSSGTVMMGIDSNGWCTMESPFLTVESASVYRVYLRCKWIHTGYDTPSTTPSLRLRLGNFTTYVSSDELGAQQNVTSSGGDWVTKTGYLNVPNGQGSSNARLYVDMLDTRVADSSYAVQWKLYVDECRITKIDTSP